MAKKPNKKPTTTPVTEPRKTQMSDESILELDMNLEDYDDFVPLPNGAYPATVMSAEKRISDKGNEYFYVSLQIHPEDYPADYDISNAPEGTNVVYARMQVPKKGDRRSLTQIKNWYRALGIPLKTNVINPGEWETKKCKVKGKTVDLGSGPIFSLESVEALD